MTASGRYLDDDIRFKGGPFSVTPAPAPKHPCPVPCCVNGAPFFGMQSTTECEWVVYAAQTSFPTPSIQFPSLLTPSSHSLSLFLMPSI